jgi:hypothetical protein
MKCSSQQTFAVFFILAQTDLCGESSVGDGASGKIITLGT